jgi:cell division protein ZapA
MSQSEPTAHSVSVTIAGRSFRMACGEGEEAHLEALAARIDQRIAELRTAFGEIGDQRLTVMAAITIADELSESQRRIADLEASVEALKAAQAQTEDKAAAWVESLAQTLDVTARRIEGIAQSLIGTGRS